MSMIDLNMRYYNYQQAERVRAGINLFMHLHGGGGVYNMTCFLAREFIRLGICFCIVPIDDEDTFSEAFSDLQPYLSPTPIHPTNIWSIGIPFIEDTYARRSYFFSGRYNINLTTWELPAFPQRLHGNFKYLDEIWTVSEYNLKTFQAVTDKSVRLIDFGLKLPAQFGSSYDKAFFGLPLDKTLFLINFEFTSSRTRKDPERVISAFLKAMSESDFNATLVIHVRIDALHGLEWKQRHEDFKKEMRKSAPFAHIIDIDNMPYAQQIGLKRICDCYVSLHRAEGYGLSCAEALEAGKHVIMTGFSGNLEILYPERWDTALAKSVKYKLVPVTADDYPWVENGEETFQYWAEADIDDAAKKIIQTYREVKAEIFQVRD